MLIPSQSISPSPSQIEKMFELEKLKGWALVDLTLDGNPLCNAYSDVPAYTRSQPPPWPASPTSNGLQCTAHSPSSAPCRPPPAGSPQPSVPSPSWGG